MLRICAALIAAATISGAAAAAELKPKFGDIGGVYYSDVAENREACRQAIRAKIALCRQNTSFESNTKDRKYPGCLPIFRQQAGVCVTHFRRQTSKCDVFGSARIDDFTGFGCTVTATVVEEGGEPERGTGAVRGVEPEDGQAPPNRGSAAGPSPKCAGMGKGAECWLELANKRGCYVFVTNRAAVTTTWSGACAGGVAVGRGTMELKSSPGSIQATGILVRGKQHGLWVWRWDGHVYEGPYVNGKQHGRWVLRLASGTCSATWYSHGKPRGRSSKC